MLTLTKKNEEKIKIYLTAYPTGTKYFDVIGFALAEDGTGIASHLSSSIGFAKHDMGLTSSWKHDIYKKMYPNGYELEWVDNRDTHEGYKKAFELNQLQKQDSSESEKESE